MMNSRKEEQPPLAVSEWGWRYHHMGIPTDQPRDGERYIAHLGMYVSGFETSPFGIEWMRFDADSPIHELIKRVPHIAFEVDDLEAALRRANLRILVAPTEPAPGIHVAMIEHVGLPIELIAFSDATGERDAV